MFRKMRRFKQELSKEECIEILKSEPRGVHRAGAFSLRRAGSLLGIKPGEHDREAGKRALSGGGQMKWMQMSIRN